MQVTCDHFTIGFVEKNRYFYKHCADAENQASAWPGNALRNSVPDLARAAGHPEQRASSSPAQQLRLRDCLRGPDSRLRSSGASMVLDSARHFGKRHTLATQQHLLCSYNWFVKNQYFQLFVILMAPPNPNGHAAHRWHPTFQQQFKTFQYFSMKQFSKQFAKQFDAI
jgi:hypothetical protein